MNPCTRPQKRGLRLLQEVNTILKDSLRLKDNFKITFSERMNQLHFVMVVFYLEKNNMFIKISENGHLYFMIYVILHRSLWGEVFSLLASWGSAVARSELCCIVTPMVDICYWGKIYLRREVAKQVNNFAFPGATRSTHNPPHHMHTFVGQIC